MITKKPKGVTGEWTHIGTVGVDAGMLYLGDPCYIRRTPLGRSDESGDEEAIEKFGVRPGEEAWREFLKQIATPGKDYLDRASTVMGKLPNGHPFPAGMVCTTGWGDGEYDVWAQIKDGRVARVMVDFGL